MLSILLTILKIIGIVLAVILGLVIVLLLVLLFVPLHYDILARYNDEKPYAKVNVTALFKIVRFRLEYIESVVYQVKVLWIKVFPKAETAGEAEPVKPEKERKSKKKKAENNVFDEEDEVLGDPGDLDYQMNGDKPKPESLTVNTEENNNEPKEEEPKGIIEKIGDRISSVFNRINETYTAVKEKLASTWDSIKQKKDDTTEKVNDILRIVKDEGNQEFVKFVWEQLKYLLRKLKPKKGHLNAHFGMDDPETTGKIAMYLAVAYGLLGIDMNIQPDFEQKIIEGELYLKGRLQLVTIVIIAVRLYMNKHFKRIVLKREL